MTTARKESDFTILLNQAQKGDAGSQYLVGKFLIDGYLHQENTPKRPAEGVQWLEKAMAQGNKRAQLLLGDIHHTGAEGVPANPVKSWKLYSALLQADGPETDWAAHNHVEDRLRNLVVQQFTLAKIVLNPEGVTCMPDGTLQFAGDDCKIMVKFCPPVCPKPCG